MHTRVKDTILNAEAKALATYGPAGINVVPVSMIRIKDTTIDLFDFFMNKTMQNLDQTSSVALVCWSNLEGVQVKGVVTQIKNGPDFDEAKQWVQTQNPDRVLQTVLRVAPQELFDISPGGAFTHDELTLE